ncbi:MAG: hypothetical protein ACYTEW_25435, partial [Planctomycetota bacterium]
CSDQNRWAGKGVGALLLIQTGWIAACFLLTPVGGARTLATSMPTKTEGAYTESICIGPKLCVPSMFVNLEVKVLYTT